MNFCKGVNNFTEGQLKSIIKTLGERDAASIAKNIVGLERLKK